MKGKKYYRELYPSQAPDQHREEENQCSKKVLVLVIFNPKGYKTLGSKSNSLCYWYGVVVPEP